MSFLYSIIISPIEAIIEFIFCFVLTKFDRFGVAGAIVAVSLAVNFLALPLYNMADAIQLRERNLQNSMAKWINHIKKTFKGDEQFMMLNTYYRINNYHPLYALRSALSIMIEIPFFIAGYHFLSHCSALNNQHILFLNDLGNPDSLFKIGSITINVLPILMTTINTVSTAVYTKGAPVREKIQTYALSLIFLVILYNSPSGLVFYWILNNLFSLAKNIVLKFRNPGKIVYFTIEVILLFASFYVALFYSSSPLSKRLFVYGFTFVFTVCPFLYRLAVKRELKLPSLSCAMDKDNAVILIFSCLILWLLAGAVLPSSVISTSPDEFSFLGETNSPLFYIFSSLSFFLGLFVLWPLCVYKMFGNKTKEAMPPIFFALSLCALGNAFLFKHQYGLISIFFGIEDGGALKKNTMFLYVMPILFLVASIGVFVLFTKLKKKNILIMLLAAIFSSEFLYSSIKCIHIRKSFVAFEKEFAESNASKKFTEIHPELNLSKTEKNVVVIFLDRAISSFFPYIYRQFPEIQSGFEGFTYYPNTLSFANGTLMASPALHGGYEYTPDQLNNRKDEKLVDKHNEALKVMPLIFSKAGYSVTMTDPCDANYKDKGGFEVFDEYPQMDIKSVMGKYTAALTEKLPKEEDFSEPFDKTCNRSSKRFSILQMIYPPFRDSFYNGGHYYQHFPKFQSSPNRFNCVDSYSALYFMKDFTEFNSSKPTFTYVYNLLLHEPLLLRAPDYLPGQIDETHPAAGTGAYNAIDFDKPPYHVNAAGIKMLGQWLCYLKEKGVFDNTRIIVTSDHGHFIENNPKLGFNPLLLVKDFNSHGEYKTDNTLMTNAETVNLAIENLGIEDVNPITGKKFQHVGDFSSFNVYTPDISQRGSARMREAKTFEYNLANSFRMSARSEDDSIFNSESWESMEIKK